MLLLASCTHTHPSVLTNPHLAFSELPAVDAQLVYQSEGKVHVVDLHDRSKFDLDTAGMSIIDITDDGKTVVLGDKSQLVILQNNKKLGRVPLPGSVTYVASRPDGKFIAALREADRSELLIIDTATLDVKTITTRNIDAKDIEWTPDGSGVVVITKSEQSDAKADGAKPFPRDVYDVATGKLVDGSFSDDQLTGSRWRDEEFNPSVCIKSDGTRVPGDINKLVHVTGAEPIMNTGFLPDCVSGFFVYKDELWLVDASGQVTDLAPYASVADSPKAYPGAPFSAK